METRQTSAEKFLPKSMLPLRKETSGALFRSVSLEKTMLTYFEVPPYTTFETHLHESEQITYVLEGKLFFEISGTIYSVGAEDTIAIPSNIPHKVWTNEEYTRAVDAWSPVRKEFL